MTILTDRRLAGNGAPVTPDSSRDSEALFREAKRRRRIRRAWVAGGLATILIAVGVAIGLKGNGPSGSPIVPAHSAGGSKIASAPKSADHGPLDTSSYSLAQTVGLADRGVTWAANDSGIYISSDQGLTWRTVTPPDLSKQDVPERIGSMDAVGQSDLWLTLIDVPGLVPYGQSTDGSDRGAGIDRSADGGRTWSFSSLPGCLQSCGSNLSVSFVNAQYGYASIGPGVSGPSLLFSTDDGGASWVRKGTLPDLGGMLGDGPGSAPQMVFTSASDGWAVTGPTYESNDHSTSSGGVLYRTTDGGNSWVQASHLPSSNQYDLPIFFDTQNGIVLSNAVGLSDTSATVYVTDDGGSTWANRQLPDIPGLRKYKPSGLEFRFDALSPSTWKVDVGSTLYSTTNVGRSWSTIAPIPGIKPGTVEAVDFSSPNYGVALWSQSPKCQESDSAPQLTGCFPTLTATIDGGRIWKPVRP